MTELETVQSQDPVRGYKKAQIIEDDGYFLFGLIGGPYVVEQAAACVARNPKVKKPHEVPHVGCTCGFYAWKAPYAWMVAPMARESYLRLEVDLYGTIFEGEKGYRAEYQRVLSMRVNPWCMWCNNKPTHFSAIRTAPLMRQVCGQCKPCEGRELITFAEMAGFLGTEISPGRPDLVNYEPPEGLD